MTRSTKWLLKLYPHDFQERMGDAWLETVDAILEEKQHQSWIVQSISMLSLIVTSMCWAAPQAHYYQWMSMMKNPQEQETLIALGQGNALALLRAKTPKPLKSLGHFFLIFSLFWVLGLVSSFGFFVSLNVPSDASEYFFLFPIALVVLILATLLNMDQIKDFWIHWNKPKLSILSGFTMGVISALLFGILIQMSYISQRALQTFEQFPAMQNSMHFYRYDPRDDKQDQTEWAQQQRLWFHDDGTFLEGKKEAWCQQANAKIDFIIEQALIRSTVDPLDVLLIQAIGSRVYTNGCVTDQTYLKQQERLSQSVRIANPYFSASLSVKGLTQPPTPKMTPFYRSRSTVRYTPYLSWALGVSSYLVQKRTILTPYKYCHMAIGKVQQDHGIINLDMMPLVSFCNAKEDSLGGGKPSHSLFFTKSIEESQIEAFDQSPRVDVAQMKIIQDELWALMQTQTKNSTSKDSTTKETP